MLKVCDCMYVCTYILYTHICIYVHVYGVERQVLSWCLKVKAMAFKAIER